MGSSANGEKVQLQVARGNLMYLTDVLEQSISLLKLHIKFEMKLVETLIFAEGNLFSPQVV